MWRPDPVCLLGSTSRSTTTKIFGILAQSLSNHYRLGVCALRARAAVHTFCCFCCRCGFDVLSPFAWLYDGFVAPILTPVTAGGAHQPAHHGLSGAKRATLPRRSFWTSKWLTISRPTSRPCPIQVGNHAITTVQAQRSRPCAQQLASGYGPTDNGVCSSAHVNRIASSRLSRSGHVRSQVHQDRDRRSFRQGWRHRGGERFLRETLCLD